MGVSPSLRNQLYKFVFTIQSRFTYNVHSTMGLYYADFHQNYCQITQQQLN